MKKLTLLICIALCCACGQRKQSPESSNVLPDGSLPRNHATGEQFLAGWNGFSNEIAERGLGIHSLMIVKDGEVLAEKWWAGHTPEENHILNSVSKTFTSTAVGLAVGEGLFSVEDKVISFFPDKLPEEVSPYLAQMTVKNLLTMAVGQEILSSRQGEDWIADFLTTPIQLEPGTRFKYNSMASFMLSAIITQVTGEKMIDYLTPRLFEPLDIKDIYWEENPQGINVGGWGLFVKTEDLAKLGLLYLQDGMWSGKRVLPEGWVADASAAQIQSWPSWKEGPEDPEHDWEQGYGYQIWRCTHNAFRADGAGGQYIIMIPDLNAVIAITSDEPNMGAELDLVWKYLYPIL